MTLWFWFWIALTAILVVGEIFTAGFFLLPFGIGAAATAVGAWFGLGPVGQWILFLVVSVPSLLLIRRFAERVTEGAQTAGVAADRTLGKTGLVLKAIQPHGIAGLVRVRGEEWRAESDGEASIPEGAEVEVLRVDGTHLVVRPREASPAGGGEGGA
jgi:membrane protein implicated in regulation of membrane protease activity